MPTRILPLAPIMALAIASCSSPEDIMLPGVRAYPETIVAAGTGTFYVSNIAEGGVLRLSKGKEERFIEPRDYGGGSIYGLHVDRRAGTLWACLNDLGTYGLARTADGRSALISFDLATRKPGARYTFPGETAECNDIAAGPDGTLYVTDTAQPRIFKIAPDRKALELLVESPLFEDEDGGADGIAMAPDGNIYVNTLGSGKLLRVDMAGGKATHVVQLRPSKPLKTADGMRHEGGNRYLVASGNGLDRLTITGNKVKVTTLAAKPALREPTGIAIEGGRAYVVEGQFSTLFGPEQERGGPVLPFRVRVVPLDSGLGI